ncbi:hypothetical protein BGZ61DRAFT_500536 [Ilyonectria robusta]|uniref:uncharacterized protein n=1 Tax=Ilyonectria robusta TaxID=1079257 RepID=UPI001E8D0F7A|nr:uncharacterized protein BGZ61DRAFT_500536 [Ilyonectria robusta]KAH8654374.1 hypothetical protein BGZ61DRAFT_500536 [Ilyonectria robusta]
MKSAAIAATLLSLSAIGTSAPLTEDETSSYTGLCVTEAPDHLRPYVLSKNYGKSARLVNQITRLSVTGNSSAGSFSVLQVNSFTADTLAVPPHIHKRFYENFYCTRGRVQLWTKFNESDSEENTRVLTQGDFGGVAHNTIHTFQMVDPDTSYTVVIQPGGFEELLLIRQDGSYPSEIGSAFLPAEQPPSENTPSRQVLEAYDHFVLHEFSPRRDDVNGMAGSGNWHNGPNEQPSDSVTPFYIAKNWGPKYLNSEEGVYKIITPLVTDTTSAGNLTMGTITMSPLLPNMTASEVMLTEHTSLQVEDGQLVVTINAAATKFLYVGIGTDGLQTRLMQNSIPWEYAAYPQYAP